MGRKLPSSHVRLSQKLSSVITHPRAARMYA